MFTLSWSRITSEDVLCMSLFGKFSFSPHKSSSYLFLAYTVVTKNFSESSIILTTITLSQLCCSIEFDEDLTFSFQVFWIFFLCFLAILSISSSITGLWRCSQNHICNKTSFKMLLTVVPHSINTNPYIFT